MSKDNISVEESTRLRLMGPVEVTVAGQAGVGKTAIATLIQQTLIDHGFTSVIMIDPELDAEARNENMRAVLAEQNPDYMCKSISIVEKTSSTNRSVISGRK